MSVLKQFKHLEISLEAILLATNTFSEDHLIGKGGFGEVYKGELVRSKGHTTVAVKRLDRKLGQGDSEFWKDVVTLSIYKYANIVSLLGFCDEKGEKILVYEYAANKSLDLHLNIKDLTWVGRLTICIGAACGLTYLHDPSGSKQRLLHRDIKSSNILLDENWNARIADLGLSKFGPANQQYTFVVSNNIAGTVGYCDPLYFGSGILTKESDVYSFGVVLFEVLCAKLCFGSNDKNESFTQSIRKHYKQNKLEAIVFGSIKDEIHPTSLEVFSEIAYRCLKNDNGKRPQMIKVLTELETALRCQVSSSSTSSNGSNVPGPHGIPDVASSPSANRRAQAGSEKLKPVNDHLWPENTKPAFMKEFEHLRFGLEFIRHATNNFDDGNFIGEGEFGRVYRGQFFHSKVPTMGAVKCFYRSKNKADDTFYREIMLVSSYRHENLISIQGFCDEGDERIIVYEYASKKGLDSHLNNTNLKWIQRLKICLGAASGLQYLHNPKGTQQNIVHSAFKSANVLLDEHWTAKIKSKYGPASEEQTFVHTNVKGTVGYCDPTYIETGLFTKGSDVYSFGVVLFELLCSRACVNLRYTDQRRTLPVLVDKCYKEQTMDTIIDVNIRQQIEQKCFDKFITVAYQCLKRKLTKRPSMDLVVSELTTALAYQEAFEVKAQE